MSINFLESHFDKVSYLQNLLAARATGSPANPTEYLHLRHQLLNDPEIGLQLPAFVRQHGSLDSFWIWIKGKFSSYAERRAYLSEQFTPLLDSLELPNVEARRFAQPSNAEPVPVAGRGALPAQIIARNKRKVFIV